MTSLKLRAPQGNFITTWIKYDTSQWLLRISCHFQIPWNQEKQKSNMSRIICWMSLKGPAFCVLSHSSRKHLCNFYLLLENVLMLRIYFLLKDSPPKKPDHQTFKNPESQMFSADWEFAGSKTPAKIVGHLVEKGVSG